MPAPHYRSGLALVTGAAVAWSTAGLFTRMLPMDGPTLLVWRGLFGAAGLIGVMLALGGPAALQDFRRLGRAGLGYAAVSAVGMVCFITALLYTTVAHVAIVYAAVPFIAAALAWVVLRERPSRAAVLSSLCALIGVTVMVGLGTEGGLLGDALALGMTLSMAAMMVIARRFPAIPTMPAACASALLSAAAALPFASMATVSLPELGLLAAFGLVNSALGLALFTLGSRHLPSIETALITALDAPLAPLWVWLFFAETPGQATLIGGSIVFAAVALHIWRESRGA